VFQQQILIQVPDLIVH